MRFWKWVHLNVLFISVVGFFGTLVADQLLQETSSEYVGVSAEPLIFVSTIDGNFRAVDASSGSVKWTLQEEPVLRAAATIQTGFTFLPDPQDGTLYVLRDGQLKKLPFTIPQLVQASPSKTDGILYAGKKQDVWFAIDPRTGKKIETLGPERSDKVCPVSTEQALFIGRTEYTLTLFDSMSRQKRWNVTFMDYSSHVLPEDTVYSLQHFSSTSEGRLVTVDSNSGAVLWVADFGAPVVALYLLEHDGLHRLSCTIMGQKTLSAVLEGIEDITNTTWLTRFLTGSTEPGDKTLYPTLFIGEYLHSLYALPSLVDESSVIMGPKQQGLPLIAGPAPIVPNKIENSHRTERVVRSVPQEALNGKNILILGHHKMPTELSASLIPFVQSEKHPLLLPFIPGNKDVHLRRQDGYSLSAVQLSLVLASVLVALVVAVLFGLSHIDFRKGPPKLSANKEIQTSIVRKWWLLNRQSEVPEGCLQVGLIIFNPRELLGRGCEGTVVYRGRFDGRPVAVKRVVADFFALADREVSLLRESDGHPNVIRYFCMESDSQFRYIALELCLATLEDYVISEEIKKSVGNLSEIYILQQALQGLAYLHSLNVVHRDIKPHNVLLSMPSGPQQEIRVVISDFGLCKRISVSRHSFSQRSGLVGTDGWIAPEVIKNNFDKETGNSITCKADIFSLGCVFYYVLTQGSHPFGDSVHRQGNIVSGVYSLEGIVDESSLRLHLVRNMIKSSPQARPSAFSVLGHPYFWPVSRRLNFLQDVSDFVEKDLADSVIVCAIERGGRAVVKGDWRAQICKPLQDDLRKFRSYKGHSVKDLLRAMRNKKHHYRELPAAVQISLGRIPEEFLTYFTQRFPALLLHVFLAVEAHCAGNALEQYFMRDYVWYVSEQKVCGGSASESTAV